MKKSILLSIVLMLAMTISRSQSIPNAGFENWTTMTGYSNPDSWSCLNDMTSTMSVYTCVKGTPGSPGTAYIKLTSKTVGAVGVIPGIAVCGTIDQVTMQPTGGFAFSQRPANLTGKWQHMIFGSSQGYVDVLLTRWDNGSQMRVPVATAHSVLSGMAMSWANFSIPLTYVDGNNPDSCIITLAASGSTPTNNDYLWVDNLAFTGTVTGISQNGMNTGISMFPNPATDKLSINLSTLNDKFIVIEISDMQGKLVKTINNVEVSSNVLVTISDLPKGNYTLNIIAKEGTIKRSLIKQ